MRKINKIVIIMCIVALQITTVLAAAGDKEGYDEAVRVIFGESSDKLNMDMYKEEGWNIGDFANSIKSSGTIEDLAVPTTVFYSDINGSEWFLNDLSLTSSLGLINGDKGVFDADGLLTREQFIAVAIRAIDSSVKDGKDDWSLPYINKAIERNIIDRNEYADGDYKKPITRQEVINITYSLLSNVYGDTNITSEEASMIEGLIADYSKVGDSEEEQKAVQVSYKLGIIRGYESDHTIRPDKTLTRAEATAVIARIIRESQRLEGTVKELHIERVSIIADERQGAYLGGPDWVDTSEFESMNDAREYYEDNTTGMGVIGPDEETTQRFIDIIERAESSGLTSNAVYVEDYFTFQFYAYSQTLIDKSHATHLDMDALPAMLVEQKADLDFMVRTKFSSTVADKVKEYIKEYDGTFGGLPFTETVYVEGNKVLHIRLGKSTMAELMDCSALTVLYFEYPSAQIAKEQLAINMHNHDNQTENYEGVIAYEAK